MRRLWPTWIALFACSGFLPAAETPTVKTPRLQAPPAALVKPPTWTELESPLVLTAGFQMSKNKSKFFPTYKPTLTLTDVEGRSLTQTSDRGLEWPERDMKWVAPAKATEGRLLEFEQKLAGLDDRLVIERKDDLLTMTHHPAKGDPVVMMTVMLPKEAVIEELAKPASATKTDPK